MKNVFLVYDDCCFYEIVILNYFMKFTGQDVVICSLNGSAITCMEGYSVNVDMALKDVEIDNIKSLIIPGGDIKTICNKVNDKLRGYYNYYGFNTNLSWLIDIYTYTLLEITSLLISKYKYIPTNLNELVSNLPIIKPYISIYL